MRFGLAALSIIAATVVWSHPPQGPTDAADMIESARHFLHGLAAEKSAQAKIPFDSEERYNFHYIPRDRKGVPYTVMTPAERKLADALLATGLSHRGMRQAFDIMVLDQVLFEVEKRDIRNPDLYYFSVFGEPSAQGSWGYRVEGHHLSLNFTLKDGQVISTSPAFLGANPAIVKSGPLEGMRVLATEEVMGRELFHSFSDRASLIIMAEAPRDIVTASSRRAEIGKPAGVSFGTMTSPQKELVLALVRFYADRMRPDIAHAEVGRIEKAGREKIHFAWAGGGNPGEPHYYRIQGPTFLIEYDNTQNDANHIHTVWRDLERDFGETDPLTAHYVTSPHHRHAAGGGENP